ncbi:Pentatricopeptide repeat-containing protein, mitochondrial [Glycine soja]|nr:Pentatricopeptide repeat-containing protein, mitochondrial [Glycine soja]
MAFILHSCICVSNRLIRMYCKCGSVKNARQVFDQMLDRNIASWHLMIGGYTSNGLGCDGLLVFPQMKQARVLSDGETFELVLTACAQAGGGGLIGVEGGVVEACASQVASAATLSVAFMEALSTLFQNFNRYYKKTLVARSVPEGCFRLLCFIIFWPWWDFSGRICSLMGIASVVAFVLGARRPFKRALRLDKQKSTCGLIIFTKLAWLRTPYCNSAPETVR